jgi:hypothetical protein
MSISPKWVRAGGMSVFSSPDLDPENPESREDRVRKDLTHRLKHVCEHLSLVDFDDLVAKMTQEQLRGEGVLGRRFRPC